MKLQKMTVRLFFFKILMLIFVFCFDGYYAAQPSYAKSPLSKLVQNCATISMSNTTYSIRAMSENLLKDLLNACSGRQVIIPKESLAAINRLVIDDPSQYVSEPKQLYGLAAFYMFVRRLAIASDGDLEQLEPDTLTVNFDAVEWVGLVGRFQVLMISAPGGEIFFENDKLILSWPTGKLENVRLFYGTKLEAGQQVPLLDVIRYSHLWNWLGSFSRAVERALVFVQQNMVSSWGWAIIVFGVLLKILLLPVALMTNHFQRSVSQCQAILEPKLAEIKEINDPEEAHNRTMAAYKELGVTPFYVLKPLAGSLIYVPILVAIFNALGEMSQFDGVSFLWIKDLAYPDAVMNLPFEIPFFGSTVNLLPFLMTILTLIATIIFKNRHTTPKQIKRQKRNLYLMAAAFFVLFYPFPACMVLYWTLANVLQLAQQQMLKL